MHRGNAAKAARRCKRLQEVTSEDPLGSLVASCYKIFGCKLLQEVVESPRGCREQQRAAGSLWLVASNCRRLQGAVRGCWEQQAAVGSCKQLQAAMAAAAGGMLSVHGFSEQLCGVSVHFHLLTMSGSFLLWVGAAPTPSLSNLAVAMCTRLVSECRAAGDARFNNTAWCNNAAWCPNAARCDNAPVLQEEML